MNWKRFALALMTAISVLLAVATFFPTAAHAEDHAVVGTGTPASCTESALVSALATGGTITFNCGAAPHTIVVTTHRNLVDGTTLDGGNLITLDGGGANGILALAVNLTAEVRNLKLQNSAVFGAVENHGTLTLRNVTTGSTLKGGIINYTEGSVTILGSTLTGSRFRSALVNGGDAIIRNSTFSDNVNFLAGGIDNEGRGRAWIYDSTFTDNRSSQWGGAIFHSPAEGQGGVMVIENSDFFSNTTTGEGGAIASWGPITITLSSIYSNTAVSGGGVFNGGVMLIDRTRVTGNQTTTLNGGGVAHHDLTDHLDKLTIRASTIDGNQAGRSGGGLYFNSGGDDILTLENVTISGNHAAVEGGGIFLRNGNGDVRNVTLFANSGDDDANEAIYLDISGGGGLKLRNTVVTGGSCEGPIQNDGGNFQDTGEACGASMSGNPQLNPLAMSGGPTPLHSFATTSPLYNGGAATCADFDQRGVTRPQFGACDIGAFEYGAVPGLVSISPARMAVGSPDFTLAVVGGNFIEGARVLWDDQPLATEFVDSGLLHALVPASRLATAGQAQITVDLPVSVAPDGGKATGARTFEVVHVTLLPVVRR